MDTKLRKVFHLFFLLLPCLLLSALVCAEDSVSESLPANVIADFEPLGDTGMIETEFKLAMVTLQKRFPEQLSVRFEGDASWQFIPVSWKCVEDYDETFDTYHFEPMLEGYTLAEETEVPMLSVNVFDESVTPPLNAFSYGDGSEIPIRGQKLRGSAGSQASYNSFEAGRLPEVRSQAPYGTCWSFSSIGAMEADLISDGAGTDIDLSELHLAYYAYHGFFDEKNCGVGDQFDYIGSGWMDKGGTPMLASFVLFNLVGAASEASVPYTWGESYAPGPFEGRAFKDAQLLNSYKINPRDTAGIKEAIAQHGGVAASIFWDDSCYSYSSNSLYCPEKQFTNHAIMIVGWDDNFSGSDFCAGTPAGNGAWLIRNSWGLDDYGREGYFWLSYHDPSFLSESVYVFDAQNWQYDHCYSYATLPDSINIYEYNDSVTAVQHFMVDGGEEICAVGFETLSSDLDVQIELSLGDKTVQASASVSYPGVYTVVLPEPLIVARRSEVTVTMIYEGSDIKIPTECASDFSYSSTISIGYCGSGGLVLNGSNTEEDGVIKLFTMDSDVSGDGVRINSETFPDNVFRNYISSSFDADHDGYLSEEEIAAVSVINFIPSYNENEPEMVGLSDSGTSKNPGAVRSLKGVEVFTELQTLSCSSNQLTTIDLSGNTKLQQLFCSYNQLTSLDLSRNRVLRELSCEGNSLIDLDVSECPDLVGLIDDTLPELSEHTVVFSADGLSLCYDIGVNLTPAFHLGTGLLIDEASFPDPLFRSYVAENCDMDGDGTLTDHELSAVKYIDCSGSSGSIGDIASLEGIERFTSLEELYCSYNQVTAMDVSGNLSLKRLHCRNNDLKQLDLSGYTALEVLDCCENPELAVLNLSGCAELRILDCSDATLLSIDLGDSSLLEELYCSNNAGLASLNISNSAALRTLICSGVQVPDLDLGSRESLEKLDCSRNPALAGLNIRNCGALTELICNDCPLLDILDLRGCTELSFLNCCNDHLSELDLTDCEWLSNLTCYGNMITVLDLLPSFILSAITEVYSPVIENGIASYPYEGHKIAFDEGVVLINIEPDFILPDDLKTIEEEAFAECAFRHVVLSPQTESIGAHAFADCPDLGFIRIPNESIYIDEEAFGDRDKMVIIGVSGGNAETFAQAHGFAFVPINE